MGLDEEMIMIGHNASGAAHPDGIKKGEIAKCRSLPDKKRIS
jgi:hypothetical protein